MTDRARTHEELQADLAAYALGSLDPDDHAILEAHLRGCRECRELLEEYEEVVDLLSLAAPAEPPPEGALDRLLERARLASEPVEFVQPAGQDRRATYLWGGFAALAALLLVMLAWNIWLQFGADDGYTLDSGNIALVVPLEGSENAEQATAHLIMDYSWEDGALIASGLPVLGPDRDYQLWFVRSDGTRVSGAVFHPDDSGQITVRIYVPDDLRSVERIGVTEEPAGGSPGPTGRNVLLGEFSLES
ncbi:anti-sigma factor [soil metagenome]